jgi:hypothetical protein
MSVCKSALGYWDGLRLRAKLTVEVSVKFWFDIIHCRMFNRYDVSGGCLPK